MTSSNPLRETKPTNAGGASPEEDRQTQKHRPQLERLLPRHVREELMTVVNNGTPITAKTVEVIDRRLGISRRFGVPTKHLEEFLRHAQRARREREPMREAGRKDQSAQSWHSHVRTYRRRQESVAGILNATLGRFADSNTELLERPAYLMLVGHLYERLTTTGEEEISTKELIDLAKLFKVLSDSRKTETQASDQSVRENDGASDEKKGKLPRRFATAVRQVYGTNFNPNRSTAGKAGQGGRNTNETRKKRGGVDKES